MRRARRAYRRLFCSRRRSGADCGPVLTESSSNQQLPIVTASPWQLGLLALPGDNDALACYNMAKAVVDTGPHSNRAGVTPFTHQITPLPLTLLTLPIAASGRVRSAEIRCGRVVVLLGLEGWSGVRTEAVAGGGEGGDVAPRVPRAERGRGRGPLVEGG